MLIDVYIDKVFIVLLKVPIWKILRQGSGTYMFYGKSIRIQLLNSDFSSRRTIEYH